MNILYIILALIFIGLLVWLIIEVKKSNNKPEPKNQDSEAMKLLLQNMNHLRESMEEKIEIKSKKIKDLV